LVQRGTSWNGGRLDGAGRGGAAIGLGVEEEYGMMIVDDGVYGLFLFVSGRVSPS
jgi:hypothetical protein